MSVIPIKSVDRVEILSVMDNSIDVLMGNTPVAKRHKRASDALMRSQLRAEHGVSMLVTTYSGGNKDSFLFDTGVTVDGVLHNMDVLEVKGNELHAVVLSHGHTDHTRGLMGFIKRYGRPRVPIVLHPDAYLKRKNIQGDGHESEHFPPSKKDLEAEDVEILEERGPTMLIGEHALVTGQIPRTTPFEKGQPQSSRADRRPMAARSVDSRRSGDRHQRKAQRARRAHRLRSCRSGQHAQMRARAHRRKSDSRGHRRLPSHRADLRADHSTDGAGAQGIQPRRHRAAALHRLESDPSDCAGIS